MIGQGAFNLSPDQALVYKTVDKQGEASELQLQVFLPKGHQSSDCRPAAVFFHGGGWYGGTPDHMYPQCRYLALRGMVAISVQYRTINVFGTTPKECVKDGKSAMRWVRTHAAELGIDPPESWRAVGRPVDILRRRRRWSKRLTKRGRMPPSIADRRHWCCLTLS